MSGIISVSLSLFNKSISSAFSHPFTVSLIQNSCAMVCTCLLCIIYPHMVARLRWSHALQSVPGAVLFVVALWLALRSLKFASIPVYVVASNIRPLCTSMVEFLTHGWRLDHRRLASLILIAIGTYITTRSIDATELTGLLVAVLYTVVTSVLAVLDNTLMRRMKAEQTAMGINLYRLTLSIPIILVCIYAQESAVSLDEIDKSVSMLLLASGFLCMFSGVVAFQLQSVTTATSIQVANIGFKVITTFVSLFTHGEWPSAKGWTGLAVCTIGIILYSVDLQLFYGKNKSS